jgi:hypothetical protein
MPPGGQQELTGIRPEYRVRAKAAAGDTGATAPIAHTGSRQAVSAGLAEWRFRHLIAAIS